MIRLIRILILLFAILFPIAMLIRNPVIAFSGEVPKIEKLRNAAAIKGHLKALISEDQYRYFGDLEGLNAAASYISQVFDEACPASTAQIFKVGEIEVKNLSCLFEGQSSERIVLGAHYDVHGPIAGADDNASGVAVILRLAQLLKDASDLPYDIELVAFTLEEPPHFATNNMGSVQHAQSLKEQNIALKYMISVEMVGFYSDAPHSQEYPSPLLKFLYPSAGNFIALIGGFKEYFPIRKIKAQLQEAMSLPVYSLNAVPELQGVDYSDHRSYWELGYEAYMLTDTSFYRNPNYHKETDTLDTLDFKKMGELTHGLFHLVQAP